MQININSIMNDSLEATDGEIGTIKSFYFDDDTWTTRYMVVETGSWLSGRKVLISPEVILRNSWRETSLPVNLTKEKVSTSPDINTDKPVSRQHEEDLHSHYNWHPYWGSGFYDGGGAGVWNILSDSPTVSEEIVSETAESNQQSKYDTHLRSTAFITGYHVHATDGDIGHITDFIVDDQTWKISFFVVNTHNWFGGKKVLIPVSDIKEVQWVNSKVIVNITVEAVKNCKLFSEAEFMHMEINQL